MALGGYRPRSGRSKSGYYKGIYCGSTYELCWAIHALDHNIKFSRFSGQLQKDKLIYIPDFLLADGKTIIESKGYERDDSVAKKTALAESLGYIVKIMRKDDLKYVFDYVEKTYGTKKFHTLYDGYKSRYSYVCANCGINFDRDAKLKRNCNEALCSQVCSGKYRSKINIKNGVKSKPNKGQFGHPDSMYEPPKLTKEQALYIYYEENKSLKELAKEFNLNKAMIHFIKKKKTYKWIHDNKDDNLKPKSYNSVQDYQTERKNKRLTLVSEVLLKFKEQNFKAKTQVELAKKIIEEVYSKHSVIISSTIFRKDLDYRNLVKEYLVEQSNF